MIQRKIARKWARFWMRYAGLSRTGRLATLLASLFCPPYKGRTYLAHLSDRSYVSLKASIAHKDLQLDGNVFIGDGVVIYQDKEGGHVKIGESTHIHQDTIIETGSGGCLNIGVDSHIQPRCQFSAYKGQIHIGNGVQIAPNCAFYPYDHGFEPGSLIKNQPLKTKGGIFIDDDAWLGVGVIVLDGARIGKGAVIGAGSVVDSEIPDESIAAGVPARIIKMRSEIPPRLETDNCLSTGLKVVGDINRSREKL